MNAFTTSAILRIGAKPERIIRHERIMPNGRKRNSHLFSIIDCEWPDVKAKLQATMERNSSSALNPSEKSEDFHKK